MGIQISSVDRSRSEDSLPRWPVVRATVGPFIGAAALTAILWPHFDEILESTGLLSVKAGVALVLLHLIALVLRAEAWGLCVAVAGRPVTRKLLHATSAPRFLADTVVPTYLGALVRVALLKRYEPQNAPTIGQMITADGLILLVEAVLTVFLIVAAVFVSSIDWWWIVGFTGLVFAALALVVYLFRRFREREFVKTIEVLRSPRDRAVLGGQLAIVLTVQPVRFWLAFHAVGLDPTLDDALVAFLLTSLYGVLPVGPGPSVVAATATLFTGAAIAVVASAGLVLVATAVIAAAVYSLWGAAVLLLRRPVATD